MDRQIDRRLIAKSHVEEGKHIKIGTYTHREKETEEIPVFFIDNNQNIGPWNFYQDNNI